MDNSFAFLMLNKLRCQDHTSNFQPIRLLDPGGGYNCTYLMTESVYPCQNPTDLDLHCLQRQGISGLSRTGVNSTTMDQILDCMTVLT